jgi:hypothetical protein
VVKIDQVTALERIIRDQHGGTPTLRAMIFVSESVRGRPVWESMVYVFDLKGHPSAKRCYGLARVGDDGELAAVLEEGRVSSPATALRAYLEEKVRRLRNGSQPA